MRRAGAMAMCVVASFFLAPAKAAAACSNALSTVLAAAVKPALQKERICKHLQHRIATPLGAVSVGVEKTEKVELRALQYCPSERDSRLTATVYVKCRTSGDALVDFSFDETVDIAMSVENRTCDITSLKVTPRGQIGRMLAQAAGLSSRIRSAAAQQMHTLCQ